MALSLSVSAGVQYRKFEAGVSGKTAGNVLSVVHSQSSPGFSIVNDRIYNDGLPYAVTTVAIRERNPVTGASTVTLFDITAATRDALRAAAQAAVPGYVDRSVSTTYVNGEYVYTQLVKSSSGAVTSVTAAGGTPTSTVIALLVGQSNECGTGRNENIDPVLDANNASIVQWEIGVAPPVAIANQFPAGYPWPSPSGGVAIRGPAPGASYAKSRLAEGVGKVIVIPAAVGSTALVGSVWAAPSGTLYVQARNALTACLAANPGATVEMLWTQGEQDVTNGASKANYASALSAMVAGFRTVAGAENAPFLMYGMTPEFIANNDGSAIQAALHEAPLTISNAFFLPGTAGMTYPADPIHYNAQACRDSGNRRATVRAAAIALSAAAPATPANVSISGSSLSWDVPAGNSVTYIIQTSPTGANAWANDVAIYPDQYTAVGGRITGTVPGAGARDVRVFSRSKGGDSVPSATFSATFAAQSQAIFTAMAAAGVTPDNTRKGIIDTFVTSLLNGATSGTNILDKIDVWHVYANLTSPCSLINWKNPGAFDATLVNVPGFTADRGFLTNGTSSEIDTTFNPATAPSPKYSRNAAFFGFGTRTAGQSANSDAGWFDGTQGTTIAVRNTSDAFVGRINQVASGTFLAAGSALDGAGWVALLRNSNVSGGLYAFRGTTRYTLVSGGASSVAPVNNSLRIGRSSASAYSARQFTDAVIGGGFTTAEAQDYANARHTYMVAIGAEV